METNEGKKLNFTTGRNRGGGEARLALFIFEHRRYHNRQNNRGSRIPDPY
jgi:hypothetical protein